MVALNREDHRVQAVLGRSGQRVGLRRHRIVGPGRRRGKCDHEGEHDHRETQEAARLLERARCRHGAAPRYGFGPGRGRASRLSGGRRPCIEEADPASVLNGGSAFLHVSVDGELTLGHADDDVVGVSFEEDDDLCLNCHPFGELP